VFHNTSIIIKHLVDYHTERLGRKKKPKDFANAIKKGKICKTDSNIFWNILQTMNQNLVLNWIRVIFGTTVLNCIPFCRAFSLNMESSVSSTVFVTNKMCPFAQKAWIALEASGTSYQMKEISLYGHNGKPGWFLSLNSAGTVPVISYSDGLILPDSELILDHFAYGEINSGRTENALSLRYRDDIINKRVVKWRNDVLQKVIPIGKAAVLEGETQKLFELLKCLDGSVTGCYLTCDNPTVADCAAFPFLWRIDKEFGPLTQETHSCGNIRKWLDLCIDTPVFQKTVHQSWWWWW